MCEYGYWLDNTETVCINWCPTGTTYDDVRESGKCVTSSGLHSIIDLTFDCENPNVESPYIQRRYQITDSKQVEFGNYASWDISVYGGANEDSIQFDDPRPIMNRGYWFNGECQFLTIKNFVWSLNMSIGGWVKFHSHKGTFASSSNIDAADPLNKPDYNRMHCPEKYGGRCAMENSSSSIRLLDPYNDMPMPLFVWTYFSLSSRTVKGQSTITQSLDGKAISLGPAPSLIRLYENAETLIGAFNEHNDIYSDFWKGFLYSLRLGAYNDDVADEVPFHVAPATEFCTCEPDQCPELEDSCIGVCAWNYWWNGTRCERCPYWCKDGCQGNGLC
jgi:hypothetical protein